MTETLRTRRLLLRPVTLADAEPFCEVANDPDQTRVTGSWRYPFDADGVRARWAPFVEASAGGPVLMAVIEGDRLAGVTGLHDPADGEAELSYWIGRGFAGRGLATEAATALCSFAFARHGLGVLTARVFADNAPSVRILRKLGFVVTGETQAGAADREGLWPSYQLRLTKEDWSS